MVTKLTTAQFRDLISAVLWWQAEATSVLSHEAPALSKYLLTCIRELRDAELKRKNPKLEHRRDNVIHSAMEIYSRCNT